MPALQSVARAWTVNVELMSAQRAVGNAMLLIDPIVAHHASKEPIDRLAPTGLGRRRRSAGSVCSMPALRRREGWGAHDTGHLSAFETVWKWNARASRIDCMICNQLGRQQFAIWENDVSDGSDGARAARGIHLQCVRVRIRRKTDRHSASVQSPRVNVQSISEAVTLAGARSPPSQAYICRASRRSGSPTRTAQCRWPPYNPKNQLADRPFSANAS